MTNKFYESIKYSTQESQVQEAYNSVFKSYFNISLIERKHQCDGYFKTATQNGKDISVLIEYKYDIHMKDRVQRSKAIAQCLGYIKKFEESGESIPKLIFIGDINECTLIHTNDIINLLDTEDVDWSIPPSNMGDANPNLVLAIANTVNPWVYDVNDDFNIKDVIDKIIDLCDNKIRKLHITEKNIEKVYNLFCDRVIKDKKKISANDLVGTFIGVMLDTEHYYQHPKKKNILIANNKTIQINGDQFTLFMGMHSTEYTPKEKRIMTAISDRLIEDTNRRNKGEFYTPTLFVDYAHKMIEKELGQHWKENYVVWDCACGTLNLTRDYRFKELYCSTLEQAELDISKQYNKEATKFQFDFLNDSLDDLKVKAPGLLEAFELNRPICFFINPPYGSVGKSEDGKGYKGLTAKQANSKVKERATCQVRDLLVQFLYRIIEIKEKYKLTNCCIACFTKPTWLTASIYKPFRKLLLNNFEYKSGILFNAGEFANVSAQWGITFNIWKTGITNNNEYIHTLVKSHDGEIEQLRTKSIYNKDNSNHNIAKLLTSLGGNKLGLRCSHRECIQDFNKNGIYTHGGEKDITDLNFEDAIIYTAARTLTIPSWINDKDRLLQPDKSNQHYKQFYFDSIILNIISYQQSYRYANKQDEINPYFWMSKNDILELANENNNDKCYEDALNSEERFVYNYIQDHKSEFSAEALAVLDKATQLVKDSFKYRQLFDESHPEYQINNWDCGWYQLKALLKEFMPNELKEFRALYKQLADKMRPMIYELDFLRK